MSMASARRYGQLMNRIQEQEREYQYRQTPEGKAEIAREAARQRRLAGPIPLDITGAAGGIILGTRIKDGSDFVVPVRKLQHMLIAGVAGSGKSVLMHSVIWQLVRSDEVERLLLIDLKGGVEFDRYRDSDKVRVVWEFREVADVIDDLTLLMAKRQDEMRNKRWQNWPGGRVFVVIDEYAEIQTDIDAADTREEKATAKRLAANLVSISRRARALGIVLICALQKATTDAMDSSLRNNLSCRICLRSANRATAASMLDSVDDLSVSPTELPTGRFYYYDASRGLYRLLQAHIAPGVDLGDIS
jgi:DNA segregation ATPase FtsK/SpoIIIE, S-DNA-T family